ncbi:YuzB family protein [Paenibacillus sp.]|uniref:YuzB family protein n=1 Tax=Paenibacillus sp. TaxID=58172 RepID=UPI002D436DAA|nr:YuzB family protein [Paenibacillus sp.]HZG57570.1 YuzB family protein [Paenibacillus sp.]
MNRLVEFCTNNMHHGTDRLLQRLEAERPDVETIEYGCLGNCGQCYLEPYVLVDGEIVAAETVEALYDAVVAKLNEADVDPFADLPLD